jgi:hypothetical protein
MFTLQSLQVALANEIDQSATAPTDGGTDWNIRLNLLNRSLVDWSNTYDWSALKKVHNGKVTVASFATYSLPADFKKLDGFPLIAWSSGTTDNFSVIDPSRKTQYTDSDRYAYVQGNDKDGMSLYINPANLISGASVQFTYYASPMSLASAGSLTECPDGSYLIQRTLYYLYKGREDGRFPEAKAEADKILARMIENENTHGLSSDDNRIHRWEDSHFNYRIGRD